MVNESAAKKLADRRIAPAEVREVIANGPYVIENPAPRVDGSKIAIGMTDGARFLTLVLQPDETHATRSHLMTGWDASPRQIAAFHRRR